MSYREGRPLPERIANAPSLDLGLSLFYNAFFDLTTCRSYGFGEGPISWLAIDRYCVANEIEGEQREDMIYYIQRMDDAYLELQAKRRKSKMADKTSPKPATTRPKAVPARKGTK